MSPITLQKQLRLKTFQEAQRAGQITPHLIYDEDTGRTEMNYLYQKTLDIYTSEEMIELIQRTNAEKVLKDIEAQNGHPQDARRYNFPKKRKPEEEPKPVQNNDEEMDIVIDD